MGKSETKTEKHTHRVMETQDNKRPPTPPNHPQAYPGDTSGVESKHQRAELYKLFKEQVRKLGESEEAKT